MVRNAPHSAMVRRRTKVITDGEATFEDNFVCTVQGLFTLLGADEGIELASRSQRAGLSGATPDQAAAFRLSGSPRVEVLDGDHLIMIRPNVDGRWRVVAVRWTPLGGRLVLSRA